MTRAGRYRAFLSYSHQDRAVAVAVQRALHRLGRAWYQRPAFTVFRDDSSLGAGALWENLERALADCAYLVLLASPEAATSEWVQREARWWVEHRDADDVLLVVTRGEIGWDEQRADLIASTTAVPPVLHGAFSAEPRWVDLREVIAGGVTQSDHPAFQDRVAELAATLHGCDKSELVGEELRQRHRWTRIRNAALALVTVLSIVAASASVLFFVELRESQAQTATAEAREFAARSGRSENPYEALALAVDAESRTDIPLPEARLAYTRAVQRVAAQPVRPVGALLAPDPEHPGAAVLSPDGRRLAAVDGDEAWVVRDAVTGARIATGGVEQERDLRAIAWSPDSRRVATVDDAARTQIWDAEPGRPIGAPLGGFRRARGDQEILFGGGIAWSPRGDRLASIGLDSLHIWPLAPGGEPTSAPVTIRTGWLEGLAWAPDGSRIATIDLDGVIRIWDALTGAEDGLPLAGTSIFLGGAIAWSPDGKRLATTSSSGTRIWRVDDRGTPIVDLPDLGGADITWSPDGGRVLVVHYDLRVVDATTGSQIGAPVYDHEARTYVNGSTMARVTWCADGSRIMISVADGSVRFWTPNQHVSSRPVLQSSESVRDMDWPSGEDRLVLAQGGSVQTWSLAPSAPSELQATVATDTSVLGVSRDGRLLAVGGSGAPVRILDAMTGEQRASLDGQRDVRSVVWAPRGPWLAAVGDSGEIWLWDVEQAVPVGPPLTTEVRAKWSNVDWAPDGTRLVIAENPVDGDGPLRLWNFSEATPGPVLDARASVDSVAWSPDGQRIATIDDKYSVWIYDVTTGARVRAQIPTTGLLGRLGWHPSSSYLAVAAQDTLSFFDAGTGSLIGSLTPSDGVIEGFAFSSDGTRLATAGEDRAIRLWETAPEPNSCEIVRAALSPSLLAGLLGPGRPAPRCVDPTPPPSRPPVPLLATDDLRG